jgi:predicted DNA-binding transcriptional regulator AlpA
MIAQRESAFLDVPRSSLKPQHVAMATLRPSLEQPTPSILIRINEVAARTGYKKSAIYGWIQEQTFPSPIRPGRWDSAEVEEWIRQNKARRPNNAWDRPIVAKQSRQAISTINSPTGQNVESTKVNEYLQAQLNILGVLQISSLIGFQSLQPCQPELQYDPGTGSLYLLIMKVKPADHAEPIRRGRKSNKRNSERQ